MTIDDSAFKMWMRDLDAAILMELGVSVHDLPDQPFRDWFDEGITAPQAATLIRENEGI